MAAELLVVSLGVAHKNEFCDLYDEANCAGAEVTFEILVLILLECALLVEGELLRAHRSVIVSSLPLLLRLLEAGAGAAA